jgi:hypothetical protein
MTTRTMTDYSDFQNNQWQAYSGYGPASGNTGGVALPQSFFTNSFSTSNFIPGQSNNNLLPPGDHRSTTRTPSCTTCRVWVIRRR